MATFSLPRILLVLLPALVAFIWTSVPVQPIFRHLLGKDTEGPTIHYLSQDPLVVYLEGFISPEEAAQLVQLAEPRFSQSILWDDQGKPHVDKAYRSSMTAKLPRTESAVRQLERRARSMPFYDAVGDFQPIVVQNYGIAGQYKDHYDWYSDSKTVRGNVASTFFVYIHANCTGGGTNFPRLAPPDDESWCEFIDCDRPIEDGVTFKPILGNAVYWENLDGDDAGNPQTLHSGQPVTSGNKMGLNMWTWKEV